ncbi:MAG: hypothetical protein AAFQ98_21650 [Bacteroidota bacterium]
MKVSINLVTRALGLTLLMSISAISVSVASSEVNKKENLTKSVMFPADPALEASMDLEWETDEANNVEARFFDSTPTSGAKVYDTNDNLIAEGELDEFGFPVTPELKEALRNATLLMTYEGVHYYRVD